MKQSIKNLLLTVLVTLVSVSVSAYDFEVDGMYFNIVSLSDLTCEVTYGGNKYNSDDWTKYTGDVIIPSSVVYNGKTLNVVGIGENAFYNCTGVTSVSIQEGITSIGKDAFYRCSNLTTVVIPSSVTNFNLAFSSCDKLDKIEIEDIAKWCQIDFSNDYYNPLYYAHNLYLNGEPVESVSIPDDWTEIKPYIFVNCTNIKSITIGKSVRKVGKGAFWGCSFQSIDIPESVDSIMENSLSSKELATLSIPATVTYMEGISDCENLKKLIFEESDDTLTLHGKSAFISWHSGNGSLCNHKDDELGGFIENTPIEELYIGRNLDIDCAKLHYKNGIVYVEDYSSRLSNSAFSLVKLEKVTIGSKCSAISPRYFYLCYNLKNLIIEDSDEDLTFLQDIFYEKQDPNNSSVYNKIYKDYPLFDNCPLEYVYIGRNIAKTDVLSFAGKSTLETLVIGDSVTRLPQESMFLKTGITNVTLGSNLDSIPAYTFGGLPEISTIYLRNENPPVYSTEFKTLDYMNAKVYVPLGSLSKYQSADIWKDFWGIQEFDPTGIKKVTIEGKIPASIYDLYGRKLSSPKKGLNIINGKKVVVK